MLIPIIKDILIEARAFEAARKKRISENRSAAVKAVWQRETLANDEHIARYIVELVNRA